MNPFRLHMSSLSFALTNPDRQRIKRQWPLIASLLMMLSLLPLITIQLDWASLWSDILQWTHPRDLPQLIAQAGGWGPVIYITIITVSVVVSQIPGAPLAIAAGMIWDPFWAGVYTIAGGFSGALIAYGLGTLFGSSILKMLTGKTIALSTEQGTAYLGGLIFVTRLLPIFSFDLISYGAGIARLSFPVYASATFLGMIPSTLLLTYMGGSVQWSNGAIATLITLFVILFVGLPTLLHRLNWLKLNNVIRWTAN